MSGGSYEYLCDRMITNTNPPIKLARRMAEDAAKDGFPKLAARLAAWANAAEENQRAQGAAAGLLYDAVHDFEWFISGDYNREQVEVRERRLADVVSDEQPETIPVKTGPPKIRPQSLEYIASMIRNGASNADAPQNETVDIEAIAQFSNCDVHLVGSRSNLPSPTSTSSEVLRNPENAARYLIKVNNTSSVQRRRVSIAIGVAHALLHGAWYTENNTLFEFIEYKQLLAGHQNEKTYQVIQAKMLAAAILMPAPRVIAYWRTNPGLAALAAKFNVTQDAAYWRVNNLGLSD